MLAVNVHKPLLLRVHSDERPVGTLLPLVVVNLSLNDRNENEGATQWPPAVIQLAHETPRPCPPPHIVILVPAHLRVRGGVPGANASFMPLLQWPSHPSSIALHGSKHL